MYIALPPKLVEKARYHGLNISKISENALKDLINKLDDPNSGKKGVQEP